MDSSSTPLSKAIAIASEDGLWRLAERSAFYLRRKALWKFQRSPLTRALYQRLFDPTTFWERRYAGGYSSGPGSQGEYARFKASFVNEFVDDNDISTVVEFGCGGGEQVALGQYPSYVGLDISPSAIERCSERFADDPTHHFEVYDPMTFDGHDRLRADLVLSLEVLFHLVDDAVFEKTMADIFATADRYVIIFSSNYDDPAQGEIHIRHRRFTDHVDEAFPEFELIDHVENPFDERVSDFYVFERTQR